MSQDFFLFCIKQTYVKPRCISKTCFRFKDIYGQYTITKAVFLDFLAHCLERCIERVYKSSTTVMDSKYTAIGSQVNDVDI